MLRVELWKDGERSGPWWALPAAMLMDLGVGFSLGMYYTLTYFGRAVVPLPGSVALGGPLLYYLSLDERTPATLQALLWMVCFPLAGLVWRALTAWLLGRFTPLPVRHKRFVARAWATGWPLLLPVPALLWAMGSPTGQFVWEDLVAACLYRRTALVAPWLTPAYMGAAVLAMLLELRVYWRAGGQLPANLKIVILVLAVSAMLVVVGLAGAATSLLQASLWPEP